VIDIGCGPGGVLHLLGKRVGPTGSVLGIDNSAHFVEAARRFVKDLGLAQVEVREGDAYDTGLPRGSFDGAHMRFVLVNVPKPELVAREIVALVRPGGWVASLEADATVRIIDPPSAEQDRLMSAYAAHAASRGVDIRIGRRTHRLFREAGLEDVRVEAAVHIHPLGHSRRPLFHDLVNNVRDGLIDGGFISREDLERDLKAYERRLDDPETLSTSDTYYLVSGRVPAR
jgi:SAM-dependent methyltransferase